MFDNWMLLGILVITSLAGVAYTYVFYPPLIWACARLFGRKPARPVVPDDQLPTVTLVIAAFNEAPSIRTRLENALAMDYPDGKLDVILASDGSWDGTASIAHEFDHRGVTVLDFVENRGKASVLNDALCIARGEVVMFSDANTFANPEAARNLASWFSDPSIGSVCGRLILTDPTVGRNVDGMYWRYETQLKKSESRLGALLGSNGGIYALRRSCYQPIAANTLVDDFVIPLLARKATGCRIVYETDAIAHEETPSSMLSEFHRRSRIGAGGFQSIGMLCSLLNPCHGWVAFTFLSHKVLRWLSPFLLLIGLLGSLPLALNGSAFFAGLLVLQSLFYLLAATAGWLPAGPKIFRILRLPALFTLTNMALLVGFFRWMSGPRSGVWRRTERSDSAAEIAMPVFQQPRKGVHQIPTGAAS